MPPNSAFQNCIALIHVHVFKHVRRLHAASYGALVLGSLLCLRPKVRLQLDRVLTGQRIAQRLTPAVSLGSLDIPAELQ